MIMMTIIWLHWNNDDDNGKTWAQALRHAGNHLLWRQPWIWLRRSSSPDDQWHWHWKSSWASSNDKHLVYEMQHLGIVQKTWWHGWQLMVPSFVLFPRHGCCFYWLYFHPVVVPPLDIFMKASWNGCWLLRSLKGNQPSPLSPLWAER